nr:hypothetical protein [Tanacetum cinerariifolium]
MTRRFVPHSSSYYTSPSVSLTMSVEDQVVDATALPKFDMPLYESEMTTKDVKSLAIRHNIPLDLHPVALTKGWTMDQLPDDMIGLYEQFFEFSGIRVPFSTFMRAIPDAMAWRHHDSDVNDPVPEDGFMVTMSEYLRFPFLSGATISKGTFLTSQDQIEQHTTRLLSLGQDFPEKIDHQKRVEVEDPKIVATQERKARDGPAISGATSSSEPLRTINPTDPSRTVTETVESREDRSLRISSPGSSNCFVHNYHDTHVNEETDTFRLGTSINVEACESSNRGSLYVPDWSIHQRCRLDTSMWCRELMVHLAPPTTQEESNALNNTTALERAWFSLARGALAQTDILERLDLAHISHLYTTISDRYKAVKSNHEGCARQREVLKGRNSELSQSMSEPFNLAIQAGWVKGLSKQRSEADLLEIMGRMENFDAYADKKMRFKYDKLFEKRYPYMEKISRGFRHPVTDLLKVYSDFPPSGQAPPDQSSSRRAASTPAPRAS